jgi:hypothetical protein
MKNRKIMISSIISLFVLAAFFVGLTVNFGNFKNAKGTEKIGRDVEKIDYNSHTNRIFAAYGRFMELL